MTYPIVWLLMLFSYQTALAESTPPRHKDDLDYVKEVKCTNKAKAYLRHKGRPESEAYTQRPAIKLCCLNRGDPEGGFEPNYDHEKYYCVIYGEWTHDHRWCQSPFHFQCCDEVGIYEHQDSQRVLHVHGRGCYPAGYEINYKDEDDEENGDERGTDGTQGQGGASNSANRSKMRSHRSKLKQGASEKKSEKSRVVQPGHAVQNPSSEWTVPLNSLKNALPSENRL